MWNVRSMNQSKVVKQEIPLGFLSGSVVKHPPELQGTEETHRFKPWVGKTPMEKEMAIHIVFLPGNSHGQEIAG